MSGAPGDPGVPAPPPTVSVRRPDDLLICSVTFGGVAFKANPPRLERTSADAFIVIEFPPQSFGEEAYLQAAGQKFSAPPADDANEVSADPAYPDKNLENSGPDAAGPTELPAARVRMAQPSRVAVTMPAGVQTIGYGLDAVLSALRDWPMRLDYNAKPDPPDVLRPIPFPSPFDPTDVFLDPRVTTAALGLTPASGPVPAGPVPSGGAAELIDIAPVPLVFGPRQPAPTVTALELPYRLVTSPIEPARWRHSHQPVEHRGRTELWHTRLTTSETQMGPDRASRIRALWSPDYRPQEKVAELIKLLSSGAEPPTPNPNLIRMSLDPLDRSMLVTLMAGFDATTEAAGAISRCRARPSACISPPSARCSMRKAPGPPRPRMSIWSSGVTSRRWARPLRAGDVRGLSVPVRARGVADQGHRAQVRIARRRRREARRAPASALLHRRARAGA